ncbi:MAG: hypothetical protein JNL30_08725 [Rubrivivax sp.]|nr:hypothetical protein [Rubrivivax sp.]
MSAEDFRAQVRELLARRPRTARSGDEAATGRAKGVCVPLRLSGAGDLDVLAELIRRVAASPALAAANATGLLRFELSVAPAMVAPAAAPGSAAPAQPACCDDCARGEPCRCAPAQGNHFAAATATPLLRGCITERDIKALPADCRLIGTTPRTVLTPLARDALRQRGIAVHPTKES